MFGQCALCPKNSRPQLLTMTVYKGEAVQVCFPCADSPGVPTERNDSPQVAKAKKEGEKKRGRKSWYDKMLDKAPQYCESGSGELLVIPAGMTDRTIVAHILDKALFPYLSHVDENAVYLNWQPHNTFDATKQSTAPPEPLRTLCIQRFNTFKHLIPPSDLSKVPEWLKQ